MSAASTGAVIWAMNRALRSTVPLPHVRVEAAGGHVADDVHGRVLVALAQDAAFALFDVGRAPRHVDVVQRDEALLDVDAGAHLLG